MNDNFENQTQHTADQIENSDAEKDLVGGADPEAAEEAAKEKAQQTNHLKQLRDNYEAKKQEATKYSAMLERVAKAQGFNSIEDYEKNLAEQELKKTAEQKNLPVEVVKALEQYESMFKELQRQQIVDKFESRKGVLVAQYPEFKDANIQEFYQKAMDQMGVDIFNPQVDLVRVYTALNYENILQSEINKKLSEAGMGRSTPPKIPSTVGGRVGNTQVNDSTPNDFMQQLLKTLKK